MMDKVRILRDMHERIPMLLMACIPWILMSARMAAIQGLAAEQTATSWFEVHQDESSGGEAMEVYFPAFAGNWYQAWIWSWGSCDDAFSVLASSVASQSQRIRVPLMAFGSL
jgi:hypothetical protein